MSYSNSCSHIVSLSSTEMINLSHIQGRWPLREEKRTHLEANCSFLCFSVFSFPFLLYHRDELFRQSLAKLREQLVKANTLVREANFLAEEMSKLTDYQVTLQIPATNLSANRKVRMKARCVLVNPVRWTVNLTSKITSPRISASEQSFHSWNFCYGPSLVLCSEYENLGGLKCLLI